MFTTHFLFLLFRKNYRTVIYFLTRMIFQEKGNWDGLVNLRVKRKAHNGAL